MRSLLLVSALAAAGCTGDTIHLQHNTTLVNATRGITLLGDGAGHGAMLSTTCAFDGIWGSVTADVDLPTQTERVGGSFEGTVIGYSAEGVHLIRGFARDYSADISVFGTRDAKLTAQGAVYLRSNAGFGVDGGDCFVGGHAFTAEVPVGACSVGASLVASPQGDHHWVHDAGLLTAVTASGPGASIPADRVAFDRASRGLILATGSVVSRASVDGVIDWSADLGADIASVSDLGARDGVVVVTDAGPQTRLTVFDTDARRIASVRLPGRAQVVVDDDGRDLSLVTPSETHNYQVMDGPPTAGVNPEAARLFED
jgi:hypothetical protein